MMSLSTVYGNIWWFRSTQIRCRRKKSFFSPETSVPCQHTVFSCSDVVPCQSTLKKLVLLKMTILFKKIRGAKIVNLRALQLGAVRKIQFAICPPFGGDPAANWIFLKPPTEKRPVSTCTAGFCAWYPSGMPWQTLKIGTFALRYCAFYPNGRGRKNSKSWHMC